MENPLSRQVKNQKSLAESAGYVYSPTATERSPLAVFFEKYPKGRFYRLNPAITVQAGQTCAGNAKTGSHRKNQWARKT